MILCDLCLEPTSTKLYGFVSLAMLGHGALLSLNQIVFFSYIKKIVMKRNLFFNDDFFGIWLELSNLIIAFGLTVVQAHSSRFARNHRNELFINDFENYPVIRVPLFPSAILIIQILVAVTNKLYKVCTTKNQVIQIALPSVNHQPFVLNNQAFNDDMAALKELVVIIIIFLMGVSVKAFNLAGLFARFVSPRISEADMLKIIYFHRRLFLVLCYFTFVVLFYAKNPALRRFSVLFLTCRFSEI